MESSPVPIPEPMSELVGYYDARAGEYEAVYAKPERQSDLQRLHEIVPSYFDGRHVLEVACGTGYWTRRLSARATSVTATDLAPAVLGLARASQPQNGFRRLPRG